MNIVVHDYAGATFQVDLSRELARRGHQVTHLYAGSLQSPRGILEKLPNDPDSLTIREVPMDDRFAEFKYSFLKRRGFEMQYARNLVEIVAEIRPDVVLSGGAPTECQKTLFDHCHSHGIRFVNWVQDFYSLAVKQLTSKKLKILGTWIGLYYEWLEGCVFKKCEHTVLITDGFRDPLRKYNLPEAKITVIPNWASIENLPVCDKRNAWSNEHGLGDYFCFMYCGTMGMKHNPSLLLQLALKYKDAADVRVVIVSEGLGIEWLKEKSREHGLNNFVFLPFQPFEALSDVLASADVLIAVLEKDAGTYSVPSKILSYTCSKRAILCAFPSDNLSACIIRDNEAGLVGDPDDVDAFLKNAETFYSDPARRAAAALNARQYAEDHFLIDKIADRFESVLVTDRTKVHS